MYYTHGSLTVWLTNCSSGWQPVGRSCSCVCSIWHSMFCFLFLSGGVETLCVQDVSCLQWSFQPVFSVWRCTRPEGLHSKNGSVAPETGCTSCEDTETTSSVKPFDDWGVQRKRTALVWTETADNVEGFFWGLEYAQLHLILTRGPFFQPPICLQTCKLILCPWLLCHLLCIRFFSGKCRGRRAVGRARIPEALQCWRSRCWMPFSSASSAASNCQEVCNSLTDRRCQSKVGEFEEK